MKTYKELKKQSFLDMYESLKKCKMKNRKLKLCMETLRASNKLQLEVERQMYLKLKLVATEHRIKDNEIIEELRGNVTKYERLAAENCINHNNTIDDLLRQIKECDVLNKVLSEKTNNLAIAVMNANECEQGTPEMDKYHTQSLELALKTMGRIDL
jgi:hypothetical protein